MLTEIAYRQAFAYIGRGEYKPCQKLLAEATLELPLSQQKKVHPELDQIYDTHDHLLSLKNLLLNAEKSYVEALTTLTNKLAPLSKTPPYEPSEGQ
jgi:hypothetical protein